MTYQTVTAPPVSTEGYAHPNTGEPEVRKPNRAETRKLLKQLGYFAGRCSGCGKRLVQST